MYIVFIGLTIPALGFFGSLAYLLLVRYFLYRMNFYRKFYSFLYNRTVDSSWFTWVTQLNHIVMDVHEEDEHDTWLSLQVRNNKILQNYF